MLRCMHSHAPRGTSSGVIADKIRAEVLAGRLTPDSPLSETALAQQFGVSRTPVREAIGQLIGAGILARTERGNARVFRPSLEELRQIYEIRIPLESLAIRIAVTENEPLAAKVTEAYLNLQQAAPGHEWAIRHDEFHMLPCRESGRPQLYRIVSSLRAQSEPYIQLSMRLDNEYAERAHADHASITSAIQARDSELAAKLLESHLTRTAQRAPEILDLYLGGTLAPSIRVDDR